MTPQEALQIVRVVFGPEAHVQDEISYGRSDLGDEHHSYWIFGEDCGLCGQSDESWEAAIGDALSRRKERELAGGAA